ncbi:MAG: nucleoside deaminase [Pseudorhodoplanes sp.]
MPVRIRIPDRRRMLALLAGATAVFAGRRAVALTPRRQSFVDQAFAMQRQAAAAGDQAYGAVVVRGEEIVGFGPSRVVTKGDWDAHAEREAIRDAQKKLGSPDLTGCVLYSTSRPCAACERTAAQARVARMYFGRDAADAGAPKS